MVVTPQTLNDLGAICHHIARSHGFYDSRDSIANRLAFNTNLTESFETIWDLERLMLITTEVAEAAEAVRKGDMDNLAEEVADILIRLVDFSHYMGIDLDKALADKMDTNIARPHMHGKQA